MGVRFLHTSDWQLGMTRAFLPSGSQARYTDDQIEAVRRMAHLAQEAGCTFAVVAGDVFDSIQPDRQVLSRALDALGSFTVPVFVLPGNHDADTPAAFWSTSDVISRLPGKVFVLRDSVPAKVPGVNAEVVGAPWPSRRPGMDLVSAVIAKLGPPTPGSYRVLVGHGEVDTLSPDPFGPELISVSNLERAVAEHRISYGALGDRHSVTEVGATGAVWYSGAPVATDYGEVAPNQVLVVEIGQGGVSVEPVEVGSWHFIERSFDITGPQSVSFVEKFLDQLPAKERTVVKLSFVGTVNLAAWTMLEGVLEHASDLFAAIQRSATRSDLVVVADGSDLAELELSGFASQALADLVATAAGGGPRSEVAADALMLLYRLAGRSR